MGTKERSIEDRLKEIVTKSLIVDDTEVTRHSNLRDDLGADSLDLVELGLQIEEAFGFEVTDEDGDKMVTFEDLIELVEKKQEALKK